MFSQSLQEVPGNVSDNSQQHNMMMPSMFDSQSSQEFYSQSHMKLNSSRDVPPHPSSGSFANDGWSDTSSPQDHQDSWRSSTYSSKPLLFQSREQQQKQMKFHYQQHQKSSMNYQSSYFQDIMQKKNAEYNQRCFMDGVEKCLYQQSVQMKETLGLVKTDVIAELKSNLESSFNNMNSENKEKALESILTSMNQIKDDLQNIETLKSSIAKKDTELQVKSETINGLQGTIDELRSTIKSLGERERNSTQTSSQLLEKILQSNTTLASKLEKSLQAGNENQKQTQILIQNTKHLTDQNNLLMEKENMILDTVRKPNVFPDGHRNLYPGADHCFKSPRILQPRFTAQTRPSPTAVVAPIRRQQCVPLDISLTNEIDVKMETSSPRKQDRTTDMFDISSDSEGEDMGNIVNNFLISSSNTSNENEQLVPCISTQQQQIYQQHQQPQQPKTQKPQICSQSQSQRPQTQSNINRQNTSNNNKLQQRNVQNNQTKQINNRQQQLQQPACQRKIQPSKNTVNKVDLTFSSSIKTSTPINNNKTSAKKQPEKASTPVQRSIRRYGKIKKSVNPFSPVHKQLSTSVQGKRRQLSYDAADESFLANQTAPPSSNIRTNRGCLAKKRKLENVFNFDSFEGDEDLKQLSKVFQRRKSNGSIKTY